jgi:hypothetical protein
VCRDEHCALPGKDDLVTSGLDHCRSPTVSGEPDGGRYVGCARRTDHNRRFQAERLIVDATLIGIRNLRPVLGGLINQYEPAA